MIDRQPSFGRYFTLAWQDTRRVIGSMWPAVLTIVVAAIIISFVGDQLARFIPTKLGQGVLGILMSAATAWVTAPYLVALYRAVATDEVIRQPESLRNTKATQRFAAWLMVTAFIVGLPYVLYMISGLDVPPDQISEQNLNVGGAFLLLVISIAVMIFTVRATTLMALLALAPERASLTLALAQTKGHFWYIVGVFLMTTGLVAIGGLIIADVFTIVAPILKLPLGAALTGLAQVMQIAVSTRLYERYNSR